MKTEKTDTTPVTGYEADGQESKESSTEAEKDGNLDDYGYSQSEEKAEPKEEEADKEVVDDEVKETVTGYDEKEEDKPDEDKTKEDDKPKDDNATEFKVKDKGEMLDFEVETLEAFVKENSIAPEVAEKLVEYKRQEAKRFKESALEQNKEAEKQETEKKKSWVKELKDDAEFGGDKFAGNIKQVDKIIDELMPNLKKVLTESKVMLPPYVMKDLAKVAKKFYSGDKFVSGDPKTKEKDESDNPLDFYNS